MLIIKFRFLTILHETQQGLALAHCPELTLYCSAHTQLQLPHHSWKAAGLFHSTTFALAVPPAQDTLP